MYFFIFNTFKYFYKYVHEYIDILLNNNLKEFPVNFWPVSEVSRIY